MQAGNIGAAVKLKDVRTGDTLNAKGVDNKFDFIKYPEPRYRRAIKPLNEANAEKLNEALTRMHAEDPTLISEISKELKQTIVSGQGEFHLKTLKWRLENNDKIEVEFQEPKIPYRETITKAARADYRHKNNREVPGSLAKSISSWNLIPKACQCRTYINSMDKKSKYRYATYRKSSLNGEENWSS